MNADIQVCHRKDKRKRRLFRKEYNRRPDSTTRLAQPRVAAHFFTIPGAPRNI